MPPAKKRKTRAAAAKEKEAEAAAAAAAQQEEQPADEHVDEPEAPLPSPPRVAEDSTPATIPEPTPILDAAPEPLAPATTAAAAPPPEDAAAKARERMERFKNLQARAKQSSHQNLKAATAESHRLAADPSQLASLHRQHATASHKLLKADIEDAGGDFERKRAWDWTAEESEKWDKRVAKRQANADNNVFQDYHQEAQKVYKRQLKNLAPDMERYHKDKLEAIERAAANGTLEIVETEDGEMVAVDRDGSFYSTPDSINFAENKPSKAAIDRLVNDQKKAEEVALRKRKERMAKNGDDGDITYINEKNKQFNQKLNRFYNKYTAEIRESFERGTKV